jgi:uncharacterized protein
MTSVRIINLTRPAQAVLRVRVCDTFLSRFRGLMLTPAVDPHGGILLDEKSNSRVNTAIHMFFMNYDIAAVWIDADLTVVDCAIARRWQPYYAPKRPARYILEIHPDRINDFHPTDRVKLLDD